MTAALAVRRVSPDVPLSRTSRALRVIISNACSYVIDKDRRLVISTGNGTFTAADALQHQQALAADADFNSDFSQLLDFTGFEEMDLDSNWLRQLAQRTLFSTRSRRAVLVNSALAIGLTRMFATFREFAGGQEQLQIFQDRDEATRWLTENKAR